MWQTESRYPLSDRLIQQGAQLFGVRFGSFTNYCLLDIDTGSIYHPRHDPLAIGRICAALEPIGLVASVACTSSYSGGIHLYIPFQQAQRSWELATATATLLENAGFKLKPGLLELFPNPKPYVVEGSPSLFNAHRLPMQAGSYLLDQEFQPVWGDRTQFVQQWRFAQTRNHIDATLLKQILKQAKRKYYRLSGKADKFINDLNAEIELGWTGSGQTNRLLGRITLREYIFHHVLYGGEPLSGKELVSAIVEVARLLPGYSDWCRHQHEIEQRAEEWAHCIEGSHYFPYTNQKAKYKTKDNAEIDSTIALSTWNQQQSESARDRIRLAIAELLDHQALPAGATARFRALTQRGIGGGSLYRHRDLWHPEFLVEDSSNPDTALVEMGFDRVDGASNPINSTSLFPHAGCNPSTDKALSDRFVPSSDVSGGNGLPSPDLSQVQGDLIRVESSRVAQSNGVEPGRFAQAPQSSLFDQFDQSGQIDQSAWLTASHAAIATTQEGIGQLQEAACYAAHAQRMQRYLESGDPILMAEAMAWLSMTEASSASPVNPVNSGKIEPLPSNPCDRPTAEALESYFVSPTERERLPELDRSSPIAGSNWFDVSDRSDVSNLLVAISIQLRRLAWTPEQVRIHLCQQFGKLHQAMLHPAELAQWLDWLQNQSAQSIESAP